MSPDAAVTLRHSLSYAPVELSFGTSGLRGKVRDITNLEAFIGTRGFLDYMFSRKAIGPGSTVYAAGDLRPSTDSPAAAEEGGGEILQAVLFAIRDAGLVPGYLGKIPSPALMCYAMRRGAPSVMVTGSHIPFDRNGIKFNAPFGEVLKKDEAPILEAMSRVRAREYSRPASQSPFDGRGTLKQDRRAPLPEPIVEARREYISRYVTAFPPGALSDRRILVWQHSAVGRDILVEILRALGASVTAAGRSDSFVPVDTEAVSAEMLVSIQALVDGNGGGAIEAVVSTDGDSDRPLVLGVDGGRVRFFPGDLLGIVTADFLGARHVTVPVSANDAVDAFFQARGITPVKTKIGSPHVIAAMREAGWEANGGFLTAAPLAVPGGGKIDPLPTRDAMLPILSVLSASLGRGKAVSAVFDSLPPRFGKSALLREFPRETALKIVSRLSPRTGGILEVEYRADGIAATRADGKTETVRSGSLSKDLLSVRDAAGSYFTEAGGFTPIRRINWLDGVRIRFENGEVAHVRPSGNAPELRLYALASSGERAEAIAAAATSPEGILRRMQRDVEAAAGPAETAAHGHPDAAARAEIESFTRNPCPLTLTASVQHYDWGGYSFIPGLLGEENRERKPCAELWIGAHPKAPSLARITGTDGDAGLSLPLDRLIREAPETVLGSTDARVFGGKLPYLFKVLDAREMLSIQAHPTKAQAEAGFARENASGIPLSAPNRSYPDDNHKPEVHVALTDFWMLHGFRPFEETAEAMRSVPELGAVMPDFRRRLAAAGAEEEARGRLLRELYAAMMRMPQAEADSILSPLVSRLEKHPPTDKDSPDFWALSAARSHSRNGHHDRGIFSIYLLNLIHLRPGQGTYQPAGTLHAYLEGANVELMASSDNVLRGGLTTKYVDTEELMKTLSFESGAPSILEGRRISAARTDYPTPAAEFLLSRLEVRGNVSENVRASHGAECLIIMEGSARIESAGRTLTLSRGGIALVPAAIPYVVSAASATALLFRAGIPKASRSRPPRRGGAG